MAIEDTVRDLLDPVIATLDVELQDVEWNGNLLRVVVDRPHGDGPRATTDGITTAQLADVNRLISPILDQHDPVPGRYTLEVSSPGVERKLTTTEHVARAVGETVLVKLDPSRTPRRVSGPLVAFDAELDTLTVDAVEVDGIDQTEPVTMAIPWSDVDKARTVYDWSSIPKAGGGKKKRKKKQNEKLNRAKDRS